ncbi:helix-turn-helix domain-containing protein [Salipiger sp. P9]|uniref:helix-turn-helix domain-containing protein n=1 Tax=Salipiger pentaromativorans TaxID=2943193 RepID=UPI00215803C5|nr:helix-turn-helix domain-containing protein [Salipiger pentaromativorans]MCR8550087.1 helix-turn-helix domain-containing protein [Salipiger pentaromativorans]
MLDIAEVARRSGVPASALRYYEDQGLIRSVGRRGLRRVYESDVLTRLSLISLGQIAGFSLAEIAEILRDQEAPVIARERLLAKADALDLRIRELTALRDGLRHTAQCTAPSHLECPSFRRLMRTALAHGARRRRAAAKAPVPPR